MGFCTNCGKQLDNSHLFCPFCGSPNKQQDSLKNDSLYSEEIVEEKNEDNNSSKIVRYEDNDEEEETQEVEVYYDVTTKTKLLKAKAKYLGGHSMHPAKKEIKTNIILRNDTVFIEKITLPIPYSKMTTIENMDDKKISKLRVIGLGLIFLPLAIVGALWKKKKLYTVIEYNDGVQNQTVVIDFGKNVEKMQQAIYAKMVESRSK